MKKLYILLLLSLVLGLSLTFNNVYAVTNTVDILDEWALQDLGDGTPIYALTITDFDLTDYAFSQIFIDIQNNDNLVNTVGTLKSRVYITDDDDIELYHFDLSIISFVDMLGQIIIDVNSGDIRTTNAGTYNNGDWVDYNLNIVLMTDYTTSPPSTFLENFTDDNLSYILVNEEETEFTTVRVIFNTFQNNSLGGVSLLYYDSVIIPYGDIPNRPTDPPVPTNLIGIDDDFTVEFVNWGYSYVENGETIYAIYDFQTPITSELLEQGDIFYLSSIYTNKTYYNTDPLTPPNVPSGVYTFLADYGFNNLVGYLLVYLFICIIILILVLLLKLPVIAFIILSFIAYLIFSFMALFPIYIVFFMGFLYLLIFIFSRKNNGGVENG